MVDAIYRFFLYCNPPIVVWSVQDCVLYPRRKAISTTDKIDVKLTQSGHQRCSEDLRLRRRSGSSMLLNMLTSRPDPVLQIFQLYFLIFSSIIQSTIIFFPFCIVIPTCGAFYLDPKSSFRSAFLSVFCQVKNNVALLLFFIILDLFAEEKNYGRHENVAFFLVTSSMSSFQLLFYSMLQGFVNNQSIKHNEAIVTRQLRSACSGE